MASAALAAATNFGLTGLFRPNRWQWGTSTETASKTWLPPTTAPATYQSCWAQALGGFGAATNFGLNGGSNPYSVAVGDFNGDGKQDLATANYNSNNVSILLGNGLGGFGDSHQLRRERGY